MIDTKKAEQIYTKSLEVLKKVQLKNGGCLATLKGERYPYIYPRDHAIIILGFLSAGLNQRAKKALEFVFSAQSESGAFPQRIDTDGKDASYKPIQMDNVGLMLYALSEYIQKTGDLKFGETQWDRVKLAVNYILQNYFEEKQLIFTPNSIHEFPPTEQGLEIWANCICCQAMHRMYELCVRLNHIHEEWKEHEVKMKEGILKYLWNSRLNRFIKNVRIKESSSVLVDIDASEYAVADFGLLSDDDERVISTVKAIEKELWNKELGGLCRYPKYQGRNNGGWGPWPHFTLMVCRHFIRRKDKRKADKYLNWVLKIADQNLLPEHIATKAEFEEYVQDFTEAGLLRPDRLTMIENTRKHVAYRRHKHFKEGVAYITIPLAWPHAEFIRTYNLYKTVWPKK